MKKCFIMLAILGLVGLLAAAQGSIKIGDDPSSVQLLRNGDDGLSVRYSIEKLDFQEVQTPEGVFTDLWVQDYANTNKTGLPQLPLLRQIITVPEGAQVLPSFNIVLRKNFILSDQGVHYPLLPRQESVAKDTDPSTVPFVVDRDFYNRNAWTDDAPISVTELGYMRGYRLFALDFAPVRYNPVSGEIEVIYSAEVNVQFAGADQIATQELRQRYYSPVFDNMLGGMLLNSQPDRISLNRYPMSYLIITPANFVTALQPFVDWKKQEGFNVTVATTTQTGTTVNAIKTYIQNIWNAATTENPAPSYLLIVGDVAQVPANSGTTGSHITDLHYVRLQGTDFIPEMYYGRFSATTEAEVTNQVNKTLMHEMYTMPSDAYLGQVVMIAGADPTYGPTHANGQINYGTTNYFNAAHGITSHTYLYPASQSSDAQIIADVSSGVGYVNYTAHGSEVSWADPTFTIANINSLQNINESSVVVGNCCLTNAFNTGICFGEAWLRATNKGAVTYIGGTNSTYWNEDYWWGVGYKPPVVGTGSPFVANRTGAYDALFHDHSEPVADWATNVGATVVMGNMAVVQSNSSLINYYWEIYSIMGDPSLIPYLGIPAQNSCQPPSTLFLGIGTLELTADPYSYVAISMNGELHGVGLADASGNLTLNFTPFTEPGTAKLVLTRSLRRPQIVNVQVVPNEGAYVTVSPLTLVDPNSNGIAEAGETVSMNLTFSNVGVLAATNLTATLSTTCDYVTLLTSTATVPNIPASGNVTVNNIFSLQISTSIPDQMEVPLVITISDGTNQWVAERSFTVNAPNLAFGQPVLFDTNGNGFLEPGENVSITLDVSNTGHMPAENGLVSIIENNPDVTLNNTSFMLPALAVGVNVPLNFTVSLGAGLQSGAVVPIGLALTAGVYNVNECILLPIGVSGEGFESGDFSAYPWVNTSSVPWAIQSGSTNAYSGNYCAKSGLIGNNASTALSLTLNIGASGNISFYRKVSSEANYDFLKFSIDGVEMGSWSGNQAWAQVSYPVSAGNRTFSWEYSKDVSYTSGSDCAWIDGIVFPMSGNTDVAMIWVPQDEFTFENVQGNDQLSADFQVRNLGTLALSGMISVPTSFTLWQNGNQLPDDYSYQITAGGTGLFTMTYVAPNPAVNLDLQMTITSNDPANPTLTIPIHIIVSSASDDPGSIPLVTALEGNYPNPFNPETAIRFSTREAAHVRLAIYNVKGQLVRVMVNQDLPSGNHCLIWNGKDDQGRSVSSGIYMYRMETPGYTKTLKMMLMK
jgi:hypothetical protein